MQSQQHTWSCTHLSEFVWHERRLCGEGWAFLLCLAQGSVHSPPQHFSLPKIVSFSCHNCFCALLTVILYASIHNDCSLLCSILPMFWFGFQDMNIFSFLYDGGIVGHKGEGSFRTELVFLHKLLPSCECCNCRSHRLALKQRLLERHCLRKGGAMFSICITLKGVHCYYIAIEQHNSEHYMKSVMVKGYTITAPSNIDKVGLLIRAGV